MLGDIGAGVRAGDCARTAEGSAAIVAVHIHDQTEEWDELAFQRRFPAVGVDGDNWRALIGIAKEDVAFGGNLRPCRTTDKQKYRNNYPHPLHFETPREIVKIRCARPGTLCLDELS